MGSQGPSRGQRSPLVPFDRPVWIRRMLCGHSRYESHAFAWADSDSHARDYRRSDVSTPWEGHGEVLAREIKNSRVVRLRAAHLSNLERPRSFNAALLDFLLPPAAGDPLHEGFEIRRAVLGSAHVDGAIAATTDLNREFQELITRYAWGTIWARPALDPRTRRLLVLAMTAALGRWEEFRLHVRTGNNHELELRDLKEVLLQVAIYAGVPAANTGFHVAHEIMKERPEKPENSDKSGR
jgi:3-oxoadipate enol-lactonase/4-carboxymuconolactone decarboxylase